MALNNLPWLMCHKTRSNRTGPLSPREVVPDRVLAMSQTELTDI